MSDYTAAEDVSFVVNTPAGPVEGEIKAGAVDAPEDAELAAYFAGLADAGVLGRPVAAEDPQVEDDDEDALLAR